MRIAPYYLLTTTRTWSPGTPAVVPLTAELRAAHAAIAERAQHTGATAAARQRATQAAVAELHAGHSVATAIAVALRHLPSVRGTRPTH